MEDAVYNDLLANHRYDDVTGRRRCIAYNGTVVRQRADGGARQHRRATVPKVNWKVDMPKGYELDMRPLHALHARRVRASSATRTRSPTWLADGRRRRRAQPGDHARCARQRNGAVLERRSGHGDRGRHLARGAGRRRLGDLQGRRRRGSAAPTRRPRSRRRSGSTRRTRKDEDFSDVWNLSQNDRRAARRPRRRSGSTRTSTSPSSSTTWRSTACIRHQDSGWNNWFVARDTEGTGRWEMWHWDLNWIFTTPAEDRQGRRSSRPTPSNQLTEALLALPRVQGDVLPAAAHARRPVPRARTASRAQWDAIVAPVRSPTGRSSTAKWGGYTPRRRAARAPRRPRPTAAT